MSMKPWLDEYVVPLLAAPDTKLPPLSIHSEIHSPPKGFDLIVVYLLAQADSWPQHVRRLLKDHDFCWDFMRELNKAVVEGEARIIFGGDGSPFIGDNGMVSCRVFKKLGAVEFVLEVGCHKDNKLLAGEEVKKLYELFDELDSLNVYEVAVEYTPKFGAA